MDNERTPEARNEITIQDLVKKFVDVTAVNGLNLEIRKGELFGLLGPNGAGKTTTISMLCGLLAPSAGTAQIAGFDIREDMPKIKERIGVCPQEAAVFNFLSGKENIELFGKLHGMDKRVLRERTDDLLSEAGFSDAANRKAKGYSGGMLRQLNLLMAMISDPEIVFLDEPTVGMDARVRRRTWEYIGSLKDQGKTIILTTHYIEEAQSLSDRVGIIDYGELIDLGTPEELMGKHESKDLEAVFLKITGRRIAEEVNMKIQKVSALVSVELKKLYRDPMNLAVLLLMPVGLTLVFYFALGNLPTWNIPGMSHFEFLVPGTMGFAVIYMIMMVSMALCAYREAGLLKRLQTTPASPSEYLGSLIIAYMIIAVGQALIVLLLAVILGFRPQGGLPGLALVVVFMGLLAITAVGLGLITATVAKSSGAASGLSMIFVVPMMVFGTFLAVFNDMTRTIARFTPNYYSTDSLLLIFNGESLSDPAIWQNLLILAIISLVAVVAGIQLFKRTEFR